MSKEFDLKNLRAANFPASDYMVSDRAKLNDKVTPNNQCFQIFLLCAASFFLLARLLLFTWKHAVNILFWDQWDFYTPLFQRDSLWQIFRWQHGPHRQGIGFVLDSILAGFTHWNSRSEAFFIVGVMAVAMLLALYLKKQLFGGFQFTDVIIPFLFLTRAQYEMLVGPSNPSHGAFPVLLTALICFAWIQSNPIRRYSLVLLINFLLVYTGFGILMGLITPALLTFDCYQSIRSGRPGSWILPGIALVIATLSLSSFYVGYQFNAAVDCFQPPNAGSSLKYLWYAGLMLGKLFRIEAPRRSCFHCGNRSVIVRDLCAASSPEADVAKAGCNPGERSDCCTAGL